jgi:hypothetical protein
MSGQTESNKSLETLLDEAISETRQKSPKQKDYDRDQLREIAGQFSRRYVTLIRSDEASKEAEHFVKP